MCCTQSLGCELFINVTTLHMEVKVRLKTIEKEYWMACESCNANQRINVKEIRLGLSLGSEVNN